MTNVLYIVLDIVLIMLGLLFVMKWGKQGLLATTLWLLVGGMMVQTVGDVLGTLGENFGLNTELVTEGVFTLGLTDITYWGALLLWMVAFFIPVKFAFIDSKKAPKEGEAPPEGVPPQGAPPQAEAAGQPPMPAGPQAQAPPPAPGGSPPPPPGA
jgi:hypothetical protein